MESKKLHVSWCVSLFVIGISTIILAGSKLIGFELGDISTRIMGFVELLALPVLVFTTVKKIKRK